MGHPALSQRPVVDRPDHILATFAFLDIGDEDVDRDGGTDGETDLAHEPRKISGVDLIQDNEKKIKIAVGTRLTSGH